MHAIDHTGIGLAGWMSPTRARRGPPPKPPTTGPLKGERIAILGAPRDGALALWFRLRDRMSRKAEIARARAAYPTDMLETELAQARELLAAALDRQFDAPIRANRHTLAQVTAQAAELAIDMSALQRDHHAELSVAYAALDASKAAFETAKAAVRNADDDLRPPAFSTN